MNQTPAIQKQDVCVCFLGAEQEKVSPLGRKIPASLYVAVMRYRFHSPGPTRSVVSSLTRQQGSG